MVDVTSRFDTRPMLVTETIERFRITIIFVLVSIVALGLTSIAVERVAERVGEEATLRAGTAIASLEAGIVGTAFSQVTSNIGLPEDPESLLVTDTIMSVYEAGDIDSTTATLLLTGAGDVDHLLASSNVRHMSLYTADFDLIWESGESVGLPVGDEAVEAIRSALPVSFLRRGLLSESDHNSVNPKTFDAVDAFVPFFTTSSDDQVLLVHIVLDVSDILAAEISGTRSAITKWTLAVIGSLLAVMSVVAFMGERLMSKKNDRLIFSERLVAKRLDEENRKLQRLDQAKNEFLSSVSHELKTPLAAVLAFTRILKGNKKNNLDESDLKSVTTIERNGWRLNALIDDLLDLSRIESKRIRLQKEAVKVHGIVEEVARSFEPTLESREQTLTLDVDERDTWINADRGRMIQVLTNIVSNAVKYSAPGTEIVLTTVISDDICGRPWSRDEAGGY
jgi:signal transduction histidine kinase